VIIWTANVRVSCRSGTETSVYRVNGDFRPQADLRPACRSDGRKSLSGHCALEQRVPDVAKSRGLRSAALTIATQGKHGIVFRSEGLVH